jgi:hypothetical protein
MINAVCLYLTGALSAQTTLAKDGFAQTTYNKSLFQGGMIWVELSILFVIRMLLRPRSIGQMWTTKF